MACTIARITEDIMVGTTARITGDIMVRTIARITEDIMGVTTVPITADIMAVGAAVGGGKRGAFLVCLSQTAMTAGGKAIRDAIKALRAAGRHAYR